MLLRKRYELDVSLRLRPQRRTVLRRKRATDAYLRPIRQEGSISILGVLEVESYNFYDFFVLFLLKVCLLSCLKLLVSAGMETKEL